jgi:hypothetical protein
MVNFHRIELHVECNVAHVQEVIRKVFLDHVTLITTANYKLIDSIGAIDFEDMPEDGLASNFHHRLGLEVGFFADACAEPAGKDYRLHGMQLFIG